MSKLRTILNDFGETCINNSEGKDLDEVRNITEQQIKDLMLELTNDEYEAAYNRGDSDPVYEALVRIRQKVNEL